jgi:hypothetical protein
MRASFLAEYFTYQLQTNLDQAKNSNLYVLPDYTNTPSTNITGPLCTSTVCTSAQLANHDMGLWLSKVANNLPNGMAKVTKENSNNYTIYTVSLQWTFKNEVYTYAQYVQL